MSINKIFKEEIVKIDESRDLLKKLKIEDKQLDDSFRFVYVAYSKDAKWLIKAMWGEDRGELEKWLGWLDKFDEYIRKEKPTKLSDYLFFLDLYDRSILKNFDFKDIYKKKFKKNTIVDQVLAESKGLLLWRYQLENLIGLFYFDTTKPRELGRKFLSMVKNEHRQEAKKLKFENDLSLYQVIEQRTVYSIGSPRWCYAYNLCQAIKT